jgi:MscS family membrane protein
MLPEIDIWNKLLKTDWQSLLIQTKLWKFLLGSSLTLLFYKVFVKTSFRILKVFLKKTPWSWDEAIQLVLEKPLSFLFLLFGFYISYKQLEVKNELIENLFRSLFTLIPFWITWNLVETSKPIFSKLSSKVLNSEGEHIAEFLIKVLKGTVAVFAFIYILQGWGVNVVTLLTSLGIGGLAVALAAKDTISNIFGGITVIFDKVFKKGDWILIDNSLEGIVEEIGLRSTKIRTFEKSLITVPNSKIVNSPVENFSVRNVRRIKFLVGVTYDTPYESIKKILEELRGYLKSNPFIAKDQPILVYLDSLGESSINLLVYCFSNTAEWEKWLQIKEDVILKAMEIVERNGGKIAFPSLSVYVEKLPPNLRKEN